MIEYPLSAKLDLPIIFDSHSHYDDKSFENHLPCLLQQQKDSGVYAVLSCAVDKKSAVDNFKLSERYDFLYFAAGIHPQNITDEDISFIYKYAQNKKCVAVGEIGLDYYYEPFDKIKQISVFEKQILLAKELDLPIIVHDRDAHSDTLQLLKKHKPKGVVHCFSGSAEMAKEIIEIGMYIGIGGVVTFKNAKKLPDVVKIIPDDRILIETDCPYLAPEPFRGKLCHSGLIPFTADKIAELRNSNRTEVLKLTCENAKTLFKIR